MTHALRRLVVLALALVAVGALTGPNCSGTGDVITLESLDFETESLRLQLCAAYAERGLTLDLPNHTDPDCP